jgi:hypothetical protein
MAKKAELESDFNQYSILRSKMRHAENVGQFQEALVIAVASFEHIDGMMQFDKKFGKQSQFYSIDTIDFVLKHAPMLFDIASIDKLEVLLKAKRTIEKNTTADLAELVTTARSNVLEAYRLWTLFDEAHAVTKTHLKNEPILRTIVKFWLKLGLVRLVTSDGAEHHEFTTRMTEKVRGKCPSCGATGAGTKLKLLDVINCPRCKKSVNFVFLAD